MASKQSGGGSLIWGLFVFAGEAFLGLVMLAWFFLEALVWVLAALVGGIVWLCGVSDASDNKRR